MRRKYGRKRSQMCNHSIVGSLRDKLRAKLRRLNYRQLRGYHVDRMKTIES